MDFLVGYTFDPNGSARFHDNLTIAFLHLENSVCSRDKLQSVLQRYFSEDYKWLGLQLQHLDTAVFVANFKQKVFCCPNRVEICILCTRTHLCNSEKTFE